jgi:hypothetical protein
MPNLRFPSNLNDIANWINFMIFSSGGGGGSSGNITLPVPNNLINRSTSNYDNVELGQFGHIKAGMIGAAAKEFNGSFTESDLVSLMGSSAQDAMVGVMIQGLDKIGASDPGSAALGIARNPHMACIYRTENFRGHAFNWKLSPTTEGDSKILHEIIQRFKTAKAPDFTLGNALFKYPDSFQIGFSSPDYLYEFKPCVLVDMVVDYHATGHPSYFKSTTAPTVVDLSLFFSETEIITKADIASGNY